MPKRMTCLFIVIGLVTVMAAGCGGKSGGSSDVDAAIQPDAGPGEDAAPRDGQPPQDGSAADGSSVDGSSDQDAVIEDGGTADAQTPDGGGADGGGTVQGCITGTFTAYWGNLHAHTSASDGTGTPAQAFDHARFQGQLDFMAITDHLEQLYTLLGVDSGEFDDCRQDADAANVPGTFVAICGYEYGSGFSINGSTGHNNVFFVDYLFPQIQLDFHDFYQEVINCPDCITQFNHPGSSSSETWNDFEYDPAVDVKMNLFEMNGGGPTWDLLFQALAAGWHIAPVYNQDNHSANWGPANDRRAGVYLSALTRAALQDAMRERRAFMSYDKNAELRLMGDTNCWMGSILSGYSSIGLDAYAVDADSGDSFVSIDFYGPGQTVIHTAACSANTCNASHTLNVSSPTYVLVRATQADGDYLISAPIWVAP